MNRLFPLALILALAALACSLTEQMPAASVAAQVAAVATDSPAPATVTVTPTATSTSMPTCRIATGLADGNVNLRACASTDCAVLDILPEGEIVTVLEAGGWLNVITVSGVAGYVNADLCKGAR